MIVLIGSQSTFPGRIVGNLRHEAAALTGVHLRLDAADGDGFDAYGVLFCIVAFIAAGVGKVSDNVNNGVFF